MMVLPFKLIIMNALQYMKNYDVSHSRPTPVQDIMHPADHWEVAFTGIIDTIAACSDPGPECCEADQKGIQQSRYRGACQNASDWVAGLDTHGLKSHRRGISTFIIINKDDHVQASSFSVH
jgi:hypothetical protein